MLKNVLPITIFVAVTTWVIFVTMASSNVGATEGKDVMSAANGTPTPPPSYTESQKNAILYRHEVILNAIVGYLAEMQERKVLPLPKDTKKVSKKDGKEEKK